MENYEGRSLEEVYNEDVMRVEYYLMMDKQNHCEEPLDCVGCGNCKEVE